MSTTAPKMQQHMLRVHGDTLVYDVRSDCKVWTNPCADGGWLVRAALEDPDFEMQSSTAYPDLFVALRKAWRVALVVRAITNAADFEQVLTAVLYMTPRRTGSAVHLPADLLQLVRAER